MIDTVGFNDKTWFDNYGHLHSDQMHIVERVTRVDLGNLNLEFLIDDPGAYSRPFTLTFTAQLMQDQELLEYMCEENNQDADHIEGLAAPGLEALKANPR